MLKDWKTQIPGNQLAYEKSIVTALSRVVLMGAENIDRTSFGRKE
jgi:hypothetical protein